MTYGASRFAEDVERDDSLLDFAVRNGRTSPLTHWKRITPLGLLAYVRSRFLIPVHRVAENGSTGGGVIVEASVRDLDETAFVSGYADLVEFVRSGLKDPQQFDGTRIRSLTAAYLSEIFMEGSQIHQNAAILLHQGLPIVKLDGLYRGMFNLTDLNALAMQLPKKEGSELRRLLMERPFGGDTLIGWKKAAFMRGYL